MSGVVKVPLTGGTNSNMNTAGVAGALTSSELNTGSIEPQGKSQSSLGINS